MKIKYVILMIITIFLLLHTVYAAGKITDGTVVNIRIEDTGKGTVEFAENLTDSPASCGSNYPSTLAFDTATTAGRATLSLLLSAKMGGKKISVKGTNSCTNFSTIESIKRATITN